ncbi:MAG: bifunctional phosphoribosylaminoimidazolecarboxamide formyltransferase/IMP cyclohydrolase [Flavisolibacter sp.]|jgi:phosphoribosylaminoimidazolecarboxamide formyltransferase/IMP cyclohydrolase|nr:bifunctional phosphoribosylaminoimidazolecarboxamide formyltransferase/IMP cyclohydrolase [Flavisolibacter sp.]
MSRKIKSALISVFYKDGLDPLVKELHNQDITIYSTGGTQNYIENIGVGVTPVEELTAYPSILGGRVKTLHPSVFGAILGRRENETDLKEMQEHKIPEIDLVIVDLYPFEETLAQATSGSFEGSAADAEKMIIEKIDIGGPSMIRAAAKNFKDVTVIASKEDYAQLLSILKEQRGEISLEQRRSFAAKAFEIVKQYDIAISDYFMKQEEQHGTSTPLRYGENPHQKARLIGNTHDAFDKLHGKELSYNNLVDVDAALQLISEFNQPGQVVFAVIKHTNVCGIALRATVAEAWNAALAGDPESAFGGVLVTNASIDLTTAEAIHTLFFEVLIAKDFSEQALELLQSKKNRILLKMKRTTFSLNEQSKSLVVGTIVQETDQDNYQTWNEAGGRPASLNEKQDLEFANIVCKHLKSNAIALVKDLQLVGKGCGQTSRIDALRQAIEKSKQFNLDLKGAVMASDAFFPFNDCVVMGHEAGITAFIQPGGSIRDKDSVDYCKEKNLALVMTGTRHFRH